jgi:hypothetical protein
VVTSGALRLLDDEELAAICAHELGHLTEGRGAHLLRSLAIVALLPLAFVQPIGALLQGRFSEPLVGSWSRAASPSPSRSSRALALRVALHHFEHRADAIAHAHEGASGAYVPRAREAPSREPPSRSPSRAIRHRRPSLLRRMFARDVHGSFAEARGRARRHAAARLEAARPRLRHFAALLLGATLFVFGFATLLLFPVHLGSACCPPAEPTLELSIALDSRPLHQLDPSRGAASPARSRSKRRSVLEHAALALATDWPPTLAAARRHPDRPRPPRRSRRHPRPRRAPLRRRTPRHRRRPRPLP